VGQAKIDAGRRRVKIRGALRDVLLAVRARSSLRNENPDAYVFGTSERKRQRPENFRNRILAASVKRANENLAKGELAPLPPKITPHSLRRTFASLLYALGESPPVVMQEMGHTAPGLALRIYAQAMRRGQDERAALAALVGGTPSELVRPATFAPAAVAS
jgi:integrase